MAHHIKPQHSRATTIQTEIDQKILMLFNMHATIHFTLFLSLTPLHGHENTNTHLYFAGVRSKRSLQTVSGALPQADSRHSSSSVYIAALSTLCRHTHTHTLPTDFHPDKMAVVFTHLKLSAVEGRGKHLSSKKGGFFMTEHLSVSYQSSCVKQPNKFRHTGRCWQPKSWQVKGQKVSNRW